MFRLPSGPAALIEGGDPEHPIVLEGYKKDEFSCLLKVMYPSYVLKIFIQPDFTHLWARRAGSLISGTTLDLCLGKKEWVSVLKLATIWNMEKVCPEYFLRLPNRLTHDII
jgi:hypothetical protein